MRFAQTEIVDQHLRMSRLIFAAILLALVTVACSDPSDNTLFGEGDPTEGLAEGTALRTQSGTGFSTTQAPSTQQTAPSTVATTSASTPTPNAPSGGITAWALNTAVDGFMADFDPTLISGVVLETRRVDSQGGELTFLVHPQRDAFCGQGFLVTWNFVGSASGPDVSTVAEGDLQVINYGLQAPLRECWRDAAREVRWSGEFRVEAVVGGQSHFLEQPAYVAYREANSNELFAISGANDPATSGPKEIDRSSTAATVGGALFVEVRDGTTVQGNLDVPHGNFSIVIKLAEAFTYTVTYLYDAVPA